MRTTRDSLLKIAGICMDKQAAAHVFAVMRGARADIVDKRGRVIVPKGTDAKFVNVNDGRRFELHGSGGRMAIPVPPMRDRMAVLKRRLES